MSIARAGPLIGTLTALCLSLSAASGASAGPPGAREAARAGAGEPSRLLATALLLDIAELEGTLLAVGERGLIFRSEDGGATWARVESPARRMLTAVARHEGGLVWAAGHDAVILHSRDGGRTWSRQHAQSEPEDRPLFDIWFADADHGLAVGAYGLALATSDGGRDWRPIRIVEEEPHLYALAAAPDGTLLATGEFGTVLRSPDRGGSWERLQVPYRGSFFGALALSDGNLLVYGLRGTIFRSEDGGASWRKVPVQTSASILGGIELTDGAVLLTGLAGTALVSHDRGRTFRQACQVTRAGLSSAVQTGAGRVLAVGEPGVIPIDCASVSGRTSNGPHE